MTCCVYSSSTSTNSVVVNIHDIYTHLHNKHVVVIYDMLCIYSSTLTNSVVVNIHDMLCIYSSTLTNSVVVNIHDMLCI